MVGAPGLLAPLLSRAWPAARLDFASAYCQALFAMGALQLPCYNWWRVRVEGDLGMPAWVHRGTGFAELCLVSLRGYAVIADDAISETLTHVVTCGVMGGALYTWHCAAQDPIGAVPATLMLCTIIKPEQVRPFIDDHLERLRKAMMEMCTRWANGKQTFSLDMESVSREAMSEIFMAHTLPADDVTNQNPPTGLTGIFDRSQMVLSDLIRQDRIFEEIAICPITLALIEYYMTNCNLSSITGFVKWKGDAYGPTLGLHNDANQATTMGQPLPSVQFPHVMNTNWIFIEFLTLDTSTCTITCIRISTSTGTGISARRPRSFWFTLEPEF